jgi:nucleoside 2-deoxyribosyltransferase
MAKIYLASSWRNPLQQAVVHLLRIHGHEVYDFKNPSPENKGFSWSEVDPNWKEWDYDQYIKALDHPRSIEGFNLDFAGMEWADICILLLPCGKSAHTEAGWFSGKGKKVYAILYDDSEAELMYKIFDGLFATPTDLVIFLKQQEVSHV